MSPKTKSKSIKTRSRKNKVSNIEKKSPKKSPIKTRSSLRTSLRTPKKGKDEPIPSASSTADMSNTSLEDNKIKDDILITPKVMKYCLNAYKQSPDYDDLKKRRFNTSFCHESPRGHREIKIFSPEEDNSPVWNENLPVVKNNIQGEPGEKYANIFMSIPGISISDSDEDLKPEVEVEEDEDKCASKKKRKKGRKKSIGYKGVPLPDECLLTDYSTLFNTSSDKLDEDKINSCISSDA